MAFTKITAAGIDTSGTVTTESISVSGVSTVGSLSIGNTSVISSARQLQNIASLDATTTATIESAITNAPNTFSDLNVSEYQITDIWTIKYKKEDYQTVHNDRSHGYSGVLYVEYDEKVHKPTVFVGPWNDPVSDTTQLAFAPDAKEGVMYIVPSVLLHYAQSNASNKERVVTSWDMLV